MPRLACGPAVRRATRHGARRALPVRYGRPSRAAAKAEAALCRMRLRRARRCRDEARCRHERTTRRGGRERQVAPALARRKTDERDVPALPRASSDSADPDCRRRRASTIRRSTRIPAASASSPTSRAASRTRSSRTRSRSCAISSIAARSAPIRAPATAPASWCRSRTSSSPRRPTSSASRCRAPGEYAVGELFMPRDPDWRQIIRDIYAQTIKREGMTLLGWRDVPTDNSTLGESVKPTEPVHQQVFIGRGKKIKSEDEFERRLYILRKSISSAIYTRRERRLSGYYPVSISCRTVIYKGMFLADQLGTYYPDLHDPDFESALALVHQRFSTNTFPTWSLAHPYRMIAHNGEINTLRGNVNWMAARQASVSSPLFGDDIKKLWPISYEGQSDTACFDNALEFLVQGGYSLAHAVMMMIPGGLGRQSAHGRGAARLLRIQRRADGAVGRPGRDRLHRRPPDRRDARPQRPAPGALFRHPRRPHHHGVGDGRAADPGKGHRHQVAPAAGQDAAGRPRRRPPHSRRGDQGDARQEPSLQGVARAHADRARRPAGGAERGGALESRAARSPAGLRLHPGRPAHPDDADGDAGRGSGRLDGQRHADLGAVRQAEAPVHLLQAELRAGDEPADRSDPRRAGDEPRLDHRAAAEPVRPRRRLAHQAPRSAPADPHQ